MPIVSCPDCNKRLKLQTAPRSGQRIKCPSCDSVFSPESEEEERAEAVAEKPEPKRRPRPQSDKDDDEEDDRPRRKRQRDDDDNDDRPRSRRRRDDDDDEDDDDRQSRKKKKGRKGGFPWILAGSIGGGLAVVIVVVLIFFNPFESEYSKAETNYKKTLKAIEELADIQQTIKDEASAEKAATRINKVCDDLEALKKKKQEIKLGKQEGKKIMQKHYPQIEALNNRIMAASTQATNLSRSVPALRAASERIGQIGLRELLNNP